MVPEAPSMRRLVVEQPTEVHEALRPLTGCPFSQYALPVACGAVTVTDVVSTTVVVTETMLVCVIIVVVVAVTSLVAVWNDVAVVVSDKVTVV